VFFLIVGQVCAKQGCPHEDFPAIDDVRTHGIY